MLFSWRIRDNEHCPCGSGSRYKACCKGKSIPVPAPSKKPREVLIMEKMRSSMEKCCLHPDQANCKGRIKEAHALQNKKIISLLAGDERHVYMLDTKKQLLLIALEDGKKLPIVEISRTSANKATTETCFCDLHDNIVFSAIEKGAPDFDNSDIMKFTYAYKAFIFSYYKQMVAMKAFRQRFKENPPAFQDMGSVALYRQIQIMEKEYALIKKQFDSQILSESCNGVYTCAVEIPQQIQFAAYAYIALSHDMNGGRIKNKKQGVMHRIALTIFPEQTKSWLLMSCLDSEKGIYESLFNQMQEASIQKIKYYLNLILPLYSENIVLSPALWNSWSEEIKSAYTYYANLFGPEAVKMEVYIGFALKNAFRDRSGATYNALPKINLFP